MDCFNINIQFRLRWLASGSPDPALAVSFIKKESLKLKNRKKEWGCLCIESKLGAVSTEEGPESWRFCLSFNLYISNKPQIKLGCRGVWFVALFRGGVEQRIQGVVTGEAGWCLKGPGKWIFQATHYNPMAGHMGYDKTLEQIMAWFYWPVILADVRQWCAFCLEFQLVNQPAIPKVPLHSLTLIEVPFERIGMVLTGPFHWSAWE